MRRCARQTVSAAVLVGVALIASLTMQHIPVLAHSACTPWVALPNPNHRITRARYVTYLSFAAISPTNMWAAGWVETMATGALQTAIAHWDGTHWHSVPSPNVHGAKTSSLLGIAAVSVGDAWAVGYYKLKADAPIYPLFEHWDGRRWSLVLSPHVEGTLNAVAAITSRDAWAVGLSYTGRSLTEHWNGTRWTVVRSPGRDLADVTMLSSTDVWAVGSHHDDATNEEATLIEHWDGRHWRIVPSPGESGSTSGLGLHAISAVSATDIWAVGGSTEDPGPNITYLEHWDGRRWSLARDASLTTGDLYEVIAASARDVWVRGCCGVGLAHWNGNSWTVLAADYPDGSMLIRVPFYSHRSKSMTVGFVGYGARLVRHYAGPSCPLQ